MFDEQLVVVNGFLHMFVQVILVLVDVSEPEYTQFLLRTVVKIATVSPCLIHFLELVKHMYMIL